MARQARGEVIDPTEVQILHCVQRCVRRAFLCGKDKATGRDYEHRRRWIQQRLEFLASVFAIDCLTFAVMHNHIHVILRSRPDVLATWTDEEVARRWLRLFPKRRNPDGTPAEPTVEELNMILNDSNVLAERRRRLSDISWWMKCTSENIARRSNREDEVTGHFWEGRFKAQVLLDEPSLLACAAYVDLNPIRAALAETPEACEFTGAKARIDDLRECGSIGVTKTHAWERSRRLRRSGWLSPIEINEQGDFLGADAERSGRRASRKGFLSISLRQYLELLDWTSQRIRSRNLSIPCHLISILHQIGLDGISWCDLVTKFGRVFRRAAGTEKQLSDEAARRGQRWMQAPSNPLQI